MPDLPAHIAEALQDYGLRRIRFVKELAEGRTWLLSHADPGEIVANCRPGRGSNRRAHLEAGDRFISDLHASGYPCPRPLARTDGAFVTPVGDSFLQVATHVPGEATWEGRSSGKLAQVGRRLGEFHAFQENRPLPDVAVPDFVGRSIDYLGERRDEIRAAGLDTPRTIAILEDAISKVQSLWPGMTELPGGLCHLDFSPGNILFIDDRLSAVIDFELFPVAYMMDVAFAFLFWCFEFDAASGTTALNHSLVETLLPAYAGVRLPSPDERASFKDVLVWTAGRWWSRQAPQKPDDPAWRLTSRGQAYDICTRLDSRWLGTLLKTRTGC